MSIRVNQYEFDCAKCKVHLVLLDYDMKCPNCNHKFTTLPRDKRLFKEHAISTMMYYKEQHNMYRPLGFSIGSRGDMMLSATYDFFDFLEQQNPDDDIKFFDEYIASFKIENKKSEYLRKHYKEAILPVLQIYKNEGFEKYLKKIRDNQPAKKEEKVPDIAQLDREKLKKRFEKLREKYLKETEN
jgi:hypothetical protein